MAEAIAIKPDQASSGLGTFERYLSLWVALCMAVGIVLGRLLPGAVAGLQLDRWALGQNPSLKKARPIRVGTSDT